MNHLNLSTFALTWISVQKSLVLDGVGNRITGRPQTHDNTLNHDDRSNLTRDKPDSTRSLEALRWRPIKIFTNYPSCFSDFCKDMSCYCNYRSVWICFMHGYLGTSYNCRLNCSVFQLLCHIYTLAVAAIELLQNNSIGLGEVTCNLI